MKIKIKNPDLTEEERTYLTADYSSGTTLNVRNNEGFTTDWYVIVGEPGQEQTEAAIISGTSTSQTIDLDAALEFDHPKSTPVYLSQWNQVSFMVKPTGGSYAEDAASPVSIEWDNHDNETLFVVTSGASTDTYKWRFKNANLGTYSSYSDELAGTGLTRNTVGYVIKQVQKNNVAKNVSDETIMDYMNDYQEDVVYVEIPQAWWFTKEGTAVSTAASDYDYSISSNWSDFKAMKYLKYQYISGSTDITYPLTWSPPTEFENFKSDANQSDDDYAKWWTILPPDSSSALGYIGLHPTPETTSCYLKPVYFFELSKLNSFGDSLVVPYPKGYIDYVLYRIYDDIKSDKTNADKYNARVARSIVYLKRLARRQLGQPELFRFRGQRGWSRLFGEQTRLSSSEARENYF